jgi:riboflavin synthase
MFTGIVQAMGRIERVEARPEGVRLLVDAAAMEPHDVAIGDSIAVNGCCLTVVVRDGATLAFDVSAETLGCTSGLDAAGPVNLEKALRVGDLLGGHLVTGHVDGVGVVHALERVDAAPPVAHVAPVAPGSMQRGAVAARAQPGAVVARAPDGSTSHTLLVDAPAELARFIAAKGSIAVQGVSLTVNAVQGRRFSMNLIPHTLAVTTLGALRAGDRVNLEIDLIARYVARLAEARLDQASLADAPVAAPHSGHSGAG